MKRMQFADYSAALAPLFDPADVAAFGVKVVSAQGAIDKVVATVQTNNQAIAVTENVAATAMSMFQSLMPIVTKLDAALDAKIASGATVPGAPAAGGCAISTALNGLLTQMGGLQGLLGALKV